MYENRQYNQPALIEFQGTLIKRGNQPPIIDDEFLEWCINNSSRFASANAMSVALGLSARCFTKILRAHNIKLVYDPTTPHAPKPYQNKDWLYHQVITLNKNAKQIAEEYGWTPRVLEKWMGIYELHNRSYSSLKHLSPFQRELVTGIILGDGHIGKRNSLIISHAENQKDFTVSVANGTATHTFDALTYQLTYIDGGDRYIGTVAVTLDNSSYEITLEFEYAEVTHSHISGGASSTVDLSKMNDSNHTITINDSLSFEGTANYTEVQLKLPDNVKNATNVSVTFTLKHIGGDFNTQANLARFGVKMAGGKGVYAFVNYEKTGVMANGFNNPDNMFDGESAQSCSANEFIAALTGTTGLQVRVIRNGINIYMLVKYGDTWVRLTPLATCAENDKTDIRLLILAHEWEFSNIAYAATTQANVTHFGHNDTASVDLSKYDTDKTITMNDTKFDGTDKYTEVKLNLPD